MTKLVRKRMMMEMDEMRTLNKYRTIFKRLCSGGEVLILTENYMEPDIMFGSYVKVFNIYIKRGQLIIKTLSEATDEDLDKAETF